MPAWTRFCDKSVDQRALDDYLYFTLLLKAYLMAAVALSDFLFSDVTYTLPYFFRMGIWSVKNLEPASQDFGYKT